MPLLLIPLVLLQSALAVAHCHEAHADLHGRSAHVHAPDLFDWAAPDSLPGDESEPVHEHEHDNDAIYLSGVTANVPSEASATMPLPMGDIPLTIESFRLMPSEPLPGAFPPPIVGPPRAVIFTLCTLQL